MTITVLVVEDEPIIRMNTVAMIEDAGYDVVEATNADDALRHMEGHPQIRAVFSDIEMPGSMDGLELVNDIRRRWPPAVLILASGRLHPKANEMPPDTAFLRKPYAKHDLLKALEAIHELGLGPAPRRRGGRTRLPQQVGRS